MAYHDTLTGLYNRSYVLKELGDILYRAGLQKDVQRKVAVIMIDLNGFKAINDTYGHLVGDRVLREVANRLKNSLRISDVVARLGGDEFLIILSDILEENVTLILKKLLEAFKEPIRLNKDQVVIGLSIGVCICPDDGTDPNDVLKKVDEAMYYSKRRKKEWVFYKEI